MAKKNRPGQGVVEYRRQAALCLSRICRESPLTVSAGFFATLVANEQNPHWYTMILQGTGTGFPALDLAFDLDLALALLPPLDSS